MTQELLERLSEISEEEAAILAGQKAIDRSLYYAPETPVHQGNGGSKSRENEGAESKEDEGAESRTKEGSGSKEDGGSEGRESSAKSKSESGNESAAPCTSRVDEVDAARVLQNGRIIDIRRHVRFVPFPKHTHNFVEFIYMCQGTTQHIVDGNPITLQEGDLLFLNQHATQEILPAGKDDIAINFMILPQFFDTAFRMLGNEESALRRFIISCLTEQNMGGNYLYFHVSDVQPVQNLMENLILIMFSDDQRQRRTLSETTMGLLFMHLVGAADRIVVSENSYEEDLMIRLLNRIDSEYRTATLEGFCEDNKVDLYFMGRLIKRHTGRTFRDLLQEKRLTQACYLLDNTTLPVTDIANMIGYENNSFFHRLFRRQYGCSPREYRLRSRT